MRIYTKCLHKIILITLCLLCLGGDSLSVRGEGVQIGVEAIFPENQRNRDVGFFDLILEQGAKQVIQLEISNLSKEKSAVVLIEAATATTDNGGVVHYAPRRGEGEQSRDNTLPFLFEELVLVPESIELAPGETRLVPITIHMPDVPFNGIIAGGIGISQEIDLELAREEAGLILNLFNFEIPVLLRQNENVIHPDLQILEVSASQNNYRNIIAVNLQNPEMMFINLMDVEAYVKNKTSNEVLYKHKRHGMQMAPNSNFIFGIPLNGELFVEGDYVLQMNVSSRNGEWSFVEEFRIDLAETKMWNDIAIIGDVVPGKALGKSGKPIWIIVAIGLLIIGVTLSFFRYKGNKKRTKTHDIVIESILKKLEEG